MIGAFLSPVIFIFLYLEEGHKGVRLVFSDCDIGYFLMGRIGYLIGVPHLGVTTGLLEFSPCQDKTLIPEFVDSC